MTQLVAYPNKFTNTKYPCIIAGDLRCPDIEWAKSFPPSDNIQDKLLDFYVNHGFRQLVREPTRLGNILDVMLTNELLIIRDVNVQAPFTS
jgi:hypothetical protein